MIKLNNLSYFKNFSFLICRHGQSIWNKENKFTGWSNISLTKKGKMDAFHISNIIKENNMIPTKIYTSDTKRTIDTANIINKSLDLNLEIESSWLLNEKHYGGCEGISREYVEKRYGEAYTDFLRKNYLVRPPSLEDINNQRIKNSYGNDEYNLEKKYYYENNNLEFMGENCHMVSQRINKYFLENILINNESNYLPLIVTHKHPIRVLCKSLLGLKEDKFEKTDFDNKSILYINSNQGKISLNRLSKI
tara:strand:+ start:2437 stop:3183 length:747 start_codon:yes stop_codon:yes gene_type:complete